MLCENTKKKRLNQQIWVWHISKYCCFFPRLFKDGGRVGKAIVKLCHPLQSANFSMLLDQNSLCYVNIMTFESILGVFLFKTGMFQGIKNEINITKFKTWCSKVSYRELEKLHTTLYLFCFQMSCVVFWNQKRVVRKKV